MLYLILTITVNDIHLLLQLHLTTCMSWVRWDHLGDTWLRLGRPAVTMAQQALGCLEFPVPLLSFVFNPQASLVQHFESLISEICLRGLCATVTLTACIKAQPASKRHYRYGPPHDSCHTTGKPHQLESQSQPRCF